jgi:hypothetical protein
VEGIGCVIREWREDVLLGMTKFWSPWSRVPGRPSRSPVLGRTKEAWLLSEGAIIAGFQDTRSRAQLGLLLL